MTGVPAPAGWETRAPHLPGCVAEWVLDAGNHSTLQLRIIGPRTHGHTTNPPRIELHIGPAGSIPISLDDPETIRRFGWRVLTGLHTAAAVLELGAAVEPDPQRTFDDLLQETPA